MGAMMDPVKTEFLRRNPEKTVISETETGSFTGDIGPFTPIARAFGNQFLAGGILDEGKEQPQFGSSSAVTRKTITRKPSAKKSAPTKTKLAQPRRAPAKKQLSPGPTKLRKTELTRLGA